MNTLDLLKLTKKQKANGVWLSGTEGEGEFRKWYDEDFYIELFFKNGLIQTNYYKNNKIKKEKTKNGKSNNKRR